MKIRAGFVSNSSTSSFVIFGTKLTKEEAKDAFIEDEVLTLASGAELVDNEWYQDRDFDGEIYIGWGVTGDEGESIHDLGEILNKAADVLDRAGIVRKIDYIHCYARRD